MKTVKSIILSALGIIFIASCSDDSVIYKHVIQNNTDETITINASSDACGEDNGFKVNAGTEVTVHESKMMIAPTTCIDHTYSVEGLTDITDINDSENWEFSRHGNQAICRFSFNYTDSARAAAHCPNH